MGRLLLVSNRLPVTARFDKGELQLERSAGGLASGLAKAHEDSGGVWIGWPGELPRLSNGLRGKLESALEELRIVPVYLNRAEVKGFYEDVANGVLWPVMHYRIDQLPLNPGGWSVFRKVSERFARAAIEAYRPGDVIWVHDYQLALVPALIREALPNARIGFFLHIPFPSADVFGVIPWRREILEGLLAADLVGFHTREYSDHFLDACRRLLNADSIGASVIWRGRQTAAGAFPLGIDTKFWSELAAQPEVAAKADDIRREAGGRRLLVGIDRLDYTKGLLRRLTALELLFKADPQLAQRIRLIQLIVPSREALEYYSTLKRRVDEVIGRINGRYGTTSDAPPIRVLNRNLPPEEIVALYAAADVMLVTPLRDGMNLVAKEFIATRLGDDGVLVLSEFAGAAHELIDAIVVNPYNVEDLARSIKQALDMKPREQTKRMHSMRRQVMRNDVHLWTERFLRALSATEALPDVEEQETRLAARALG